MCKKLKLPVKAFQALILIMVIFQQCTTSSGQRCFGPVWKTNVYSLNNGFVHVNKANKQIFDNKSNESYLYKISTPLNDVKMRHHHRPSYRTELREDRHAFYLFDPLTKRFLCWKRVNGSMTTMNYENIRRKSHWDLCKFSDIPDDKQYAKTHVHLQLAGHPGHTMRFKKGRNISHKQIQKCKRKSIEIGRNYKKCLGSDLFLLYNTHNYEDCCSEAYKMLCKGKTADMEELRDVCGAAKSCERVL